MQARLRAENVAAERFPATSGRDLTPAELRTKATFGARYFCTRGMIGCSLSHQRVWERVVDERLGAVVVLEDDAVLFPGFNRSLGRILRELPAGWDVCLIGALGCIGAEREALPMKCFGALVGGTRPSPGRTRRVSRSLFVPYKPVGTHAYVVSYRGAAKLRELIPRARYHIDITAWSLRELNLYAARDFLATQEFAGTSTVGSSSNLLTKYAFQWAVELCGLAEMTRRGGITSLAWAWKVVLYALPLGPRRLSIDWGPCTVVFVLIMLSCVPLRSFRPMALASAYVGLHSCVIRALGGNLRPHNAAVFVLVSAALWRCR